MLRSAQDPRGSRHRTRAPQGSRKGLWCGWSREPDETKLKGDMRGTGKDPECNTPITSLYSAVETVIVSREK